MSCVGRVAQRKSTNLVSDAAEIGQGKKGQEGQLTSPNADGSCETSDRNADRIKIRVGRLPSLLQRRSVCLVGLVFLELLGFFLSCESYRIYILPPRRDIAPQAEMSVKRWSLATCSEVARPIKSLN